MRVNAGRKRRTQFFADAFREHLETCTKDAEIVRVVADYVSGMTERELLINYRQIEGHNS